MQVVVLIRLLAKLRKSLRREPRSATSDGNGVGTLRKYEESSEWYLRNFNECPRILDL